VKIESATFTIAAYRPDQEPAAPGPDVLFLGRSNVGKSSLINALLGKKGLARTSSTPGRTQSVNFYRINDRVWFVDLPGYGYAKAPVAVRRAWRPMIEGALVRRAERVALAMLLVDARREPAELDLVMRDWLEAGGHPWLAVATKADKLSGNGRAKARRTIDRDLTGVHRVGETVMTSVETGMGIRDVWKHLDEAIDG
jgi:GTP-binding protein